MREVTLIVGVLCFVSAAIDAVHWLTGDGLVYLRCTMLNMAVGIMCLRGVRVPMAAREGGE